MFSSKHTDRFINKFSNTGYFELQLGEQRIHFATHRCDEIILDIRNI